MNSVAVLFASLALAVPAGLAGEGAATPTPDVWHSAPERVSRPAEPSVAAEQPFAAYLRGYRPEAYNQVRIEQRVIIRIAPARRARQDLLAELPQGAVTTRLEERPMKRCVPVANIAGVQSGPQNRLILFMRDRHIVSAALENSCSARDFYSGFYVERSKDGLLCSGRDTLQSRTGASCGVARLSVLVEAKD